MLWGGTGAGKSMVSTALALGCAGGGSCLGWSFPKPCRVLVVDGEQSERDIQKRFLSLADTVEGIDTELAAQNLIIMPRTAQTGGEFVDIANKEQADAIVDAVKRNRVGVVFFDNLSTLTDSVEGENEAHRFKTMQALLSRLKGENVACIVVHHAGKNGQSYRGSSGIATTFERILGLIKDPASGADTLSVMVKVEKFRDKAPVGFQPEFPLTLKENERGTLCWEIGDHHQLRAGWLMFQQGNHKTVAEFVAAYNARFGTKKHASNFANEFERKWRLKLAIPEHEIRQAKTWMKERAEYSQDDDSGTSSMAGAY